MLSKDEIQKILDANEDIITYKADKDYRCLTSTEKALLKNNRKIKEYIKQLELNKPDWQQLCEECSTITKKAGLTKADTDRIIRETREMTEKANKYDSLVKKIKDKIEDLGISDVDIYLQCELQELLKEEEDE